MGSDSDTSASESRSSTSHPTLSDSTPRSTLTSPSDLLLEADDLAESSERTPSRARAAVLMTTRNKCRIPVKKLHCTCSPVRHSVCLLLFNTLSSSKNKKKKKKKKKKVPALIPLL